MCGKWSLLDAEQAGLVEEMGAPDSRLLVQPLVPPLIRPMVFDLVCGLTSFTALCSSSIP